MERTYAVVEAHDGDYAGAFSVLDTYTSEQEAVARRDEIIRRRAAASSPWPTPTRVSAKVIQVWKRVR